MLICGNLVTSINHNQKILCGCLHCKLYESHAVKNYHALIFFLIFTLKFLTHYKSTMYDQTWGSVKGQICNWLFHLYVCSILVDKTKKIPMISQHQLSWPMTWWCTNYTYKKNCEISRASEYTPLNYLLYRYKRKSRFKRDIYHCWTCICVKLGFIKNPEGRYR